MRRKLQQFSMICPFMNARSPKYFQHVEKNGSDVKMQRNASKRALATHLNASQRAMLRFHTMHRCTVCVSERWCTMVRCILACLVMWYVSLRCIGAPFAFLYDAPMHRSLSWDVVRFATMLCAMLRCILTNLVMWYVLLRCTDATMLCAMLRCILTNLGMLRFIKMHRAMLIMAYYHLLSFQDILRTCKIVSNRKKNVQNRIIVRQRALA